VDLKGDFFIGALPITGQLTFRTMSPLNLIPGRSLNEESVRGRGAGSAGLCGRET
jgi:hypothetical protein